MLDAVSRLASEGFSVAIASHQPNNALLYGDRAVFLVNGEAKLQGAPAEAITEATLRAAYGMDFEIIRGEENASRAILPLIHRSGSRTELD